jgi:NADPH:quinone reductase-like Zn-dependent oxidoreductase
MKQQSTRLWFTDTFTVEFQKASIDCGEKQFLVRNTYSLISPGTELALYTGTHVGFSDPDIIWAKYPIQPGYASVGVIEESRGRSKGKIGDTVLHFSPHSSHSLLNAENDMFFVLEQKLDEKAALFARFAQIAATAVNIRHIQPASILILGAGLIGNLCAQLYQLQHDTVLLADISERRLEIAQQCGVHRVLNSSAMDFSEKLHTLTNGHGIDLVIEVTGVPELVVQALELVNEFGEVLLLSSTRGTVDLNVYKLIHRKKTMLTGAHEGYFPLKSEDGLSHEKFVNDILKNIADKNITTAPLISHKISHQEVKRAYEGLLHEKERYLGVIINWMKEE